MRRFRRFHEDGDSEMNERRLANIEKMLGKLTGMKTINELDSEYHADIRAGAPKTFRACGHPFPAVNTLVSDGSGNLHEQMYVCEKCGVKEGYP